MIVDVLRIIAIFVVVLAEVGAMCLTDKIIFLKIQQT